MIPGFGESTYRIPRSLSFESMDEAEFHDAAKNICRFIAERYWTGMEDGAIMTMAEAMIQEYETHHAPGNAWPEVTQHDIDAGILNIEIFRTGNRMFMILETDDAFSFEKKAIFDQGNPKIAEWEALMWKFQKPLPWAKEGEKWVLMNRIFKS